jgi:hypothetical protein
MIDPPWHLLVDTRKYVPIALFDVLSQKVVSLITMMRLFDWVSLFSF